MSKILIPIKKLGHYLLKINRELILKRLKINRERLDSLKYLKTNAEDFLLNRKDFLKIMKDIEKTEFIIQKLERKLWEIK